MPTPVTFENLRELIVYHLDITSNDHVLITSRFGADLQADELAVVELILACEETYGIAIADDDIDELVTVQDYLNLIQKKQGTA